MKVSIFLTARDGGYNATALYEDGKITVQKGSLIRMSFADHIRGGRIAKQYRNDPSVVDEKGIVKKDCMFSSPSTAAQFVMGSSTNGWTAWHVDKKTSLRKYVDANKQED
ncbi:MAG: DUF4357 domain-containing protein [Clostridiales bacterium]|nr:DUF4357 domain-containing protein [Clostridiales bacterium]